MFFHCFGKEIIKMATEMFPFTVAIFFRLIIYMVIHIKLYVRATCRSRYIFSSFMISLMRCKVEMRVGTKGRRSTFLIYPIS